MKYPTTRVVFDRKKEATKQKSALVQIEILYERKRKYLSTGVKVYKDQWKDKTMVTGRTDAIELNNRISLIHDNIKSCINSFIKNNEEFSFEKMDVSLTVKKGGDSFIDFVHDRIYERCMKESTRKQHLVMYRKLVAFGGMEKFSDVTLKNIKLFDDFERRFTSNQSTVHGIHKRLKVYVKEALQYGHINDNPYNYMSIPKGSPSIRKYLTEEEIEKIRNAKIIDSSINNVRDCFIFCCFTGLAYADLRNFDWEKCVWKDGDKYVIRDKRVKTETPYNITILSPAMEILEKHNFKLPVISNQQYNMRLKVLASYAGINKCLTSHVARHTFATWALSHGIRIEVVSKMLAHTDIKTTQLYAKILQEDVSDGFDVLEGELKSKNERN